jgi:hypothetical protein
MMWEAHQKNTLKLGRDWKVAVCQLNQSRSEHYLPVEIRSGGNQEVRLERRAVMKRKKGEE